MSAFGQEFDDVAEAMIVLRHHDGSQTAWTVNQPGRCGWEPAGMINGSARAVVQIEGEFHRRRKTPASMQIERKLHARAEIAARDMRELEGP